MKVFSKVLTVCKFPDNGVNTLTTVLQYNTSVGISGIIEGR